MTSLDSLTIHPSDMRHDVGHAEKTSLHVVNSVRTKLQSDARSLELPGSVKVGTVGSQGHPRH